MMEGGKIYNAFGPSQNARGGRGQILAKLAYLLPLIQLALGTFHIPGPALIPATFALYAFTRLVAAGDGKSGSAPPAPLIRRAIPTS